MSTTGKQLIVDQVKQYFGQNEAVFFANFDGLVVADERVLRDKVREFKAKIKVVKISLVRLALDKYLSENNSADVFQDADLTEVIGGKLALILSSEDSQVVAKEMSAFQKSIEKEKFILGGIYKGRVLWKSTQIGAIAKYPSKLGAVQMLACLLSSPLSSLARALKEVATKK